MVSPQKIKYNSVNQSIHDVLNPMEVILDVAFDSDDGTVSSYLNRSAVAAESYDGRYKNTYRYKYDELFSPSFTIVKKDFSDFTRDEVRKVLKYLTSTDNPALLEVYYDGKSSAADWACIGGWTSIEMYKISNSRTVGIVAKFEAITPYAFSEIMHKAPEKSTDKTLTIDIVTDDNKPIYPCVKITQSAAGDAKLTNQNYNAFNQLLHTDEMEIKNNLANEIITIDGANKIIHSTKAGRIFGTDFTNWSWLPLYDGKNVITITGNCTIEISYRAVIKCGEY